MLKAPTADSMSKNSSPSGSSSASRWLTYSRKPSTPPAGCRSSGRSAASKSASWLARATSPRRAGDRVQRALDADVDDLLVLAARQRHRPGSRAPAAPGRTASAGCRELALRKKSPRHVLAPRLPEELGPGPSAAARRAPAGAAGCRCRASRRGSRRRRAGTYVQPAAWGSMTVNVLAWSGDRPTWWERAGPCGLPGRLATAQLHRRRGRRRGGAALGVARFFFGAATPIASGVSIRLPNHGVIGLSSWVSCGNASRRGPARRRSVSSSR